MNLPNTGSSDGPGLLTQLKPYVKALLVGSFIGCIAVGSHRAINQARSIRDSSNIQSVSDLPSEPSLRNAQDGQTDCQQITGGAYDCTDEATKAKVYEAAKNGLIWHVQEDKTKTVIGSVSKYSRKDSCHNPKGKACITASGEDTKEGRTIACPRSIKLGQRVQIKGKVYTCLDRTAKWVDARFGPTYDIFVEDQKEAINFGRQNLEVAILK